MKSQALHTMCNISGEAANLTLITLVREGVQSRNDGQ